MNKLTNVPNNIEPIIAMASGFCNSEPMSCEKSNGTIAIMVVNEVMIIGRKRRIPAVWIASINELRKAGTPLLEAIHTAGVRRLRPIIMTSLTTIMAMVPLLFSSDMGSELQKPLAIAMIGSMLLGTLVSLFIIPLIYWFIYRKQEKHEIKSH